MSLVGTGTCFHMPYRMVLLKKVLLLALFWLLQLFVFWSAGIGLSVSRRLSQGIYCILGGLYGFQLLICLGYGFDNFVWCKADQTRLLTFTVR